MHSFPLIWIPLLPLLGAAFNLLLGRSASRRLVHLVACGTVLASCVVALWAVFYHLAPMVWNHPVTAPRLVDSVYTWIAAGPLNIELSLVCDPLSAVMIIVVTFVGFLIHLYSTGYMAHEPDYARFFGYLNLFTGAMLVLVLADSLPLLFVGWEGVGVCSYFLIGFWYDRDGPKRPGLANATAGKKAFIVNRVGDFAFLLGMFLLYTYAGTLTFDGLAAHTRDLAVPYHYWNTAGWSVASVAALLLFIGATGKSAQIPLYVWLPDAMAGPTPVSALIHAATMVTAGVYMIARMNFLYLMAPAVMGIVALVGAATALFAATIGFAQNDIKKVLAYSTVSQLGYMFLGVGVGAFSAGVFHLFTHAFFKACLFLCAGAVIHALHDEQDIRRMGGLRRKLPVTHWTFLASTLAIAGIPPLSGFFSKDEILWRALATGNPAFGSSWLPMALYVIGLAGALCTAFYMFRLYGLTFLGSSRMAHADDGHGHELHAPSVGMRTALIVLGGGAALLGVLGVPELLGSLVGVEHANVFERWLEPVFADGARAAQVANVHVAANELAHSHSLEALLMALSVVVAAGSSFLAYSMYRQGPSESMRRLWSHAQGVYQLVFNKYWIDELYALAIIRPFRRLSWLLFKLIDRVAIDVTSVTGSAKMVDIFGLGVRRLQNGHLQHYLAAMVVGAAAFLWYASMPAAQFAISPAATLHVGQEVTLDARRDVDVDHRRLEYRWDFDGDGQYDYPVAPQQWSSDAVVQHRYTNPGRYRVVLQVRDTRWHTERQHVHVIEVGAPSATLGVPQRAPSPVNAEGGR